ncbi:hypothetical protein VTK26DRAFT_3549 [Humicola hyalothermophila]
MGQSTNAQQQQQQQVVPGVRIDLSNIKSTTRFNDLQETLQKEIAMIDEAIQKCIRDKEAVDAFLPAHAEQLAAIPTDVSFVTRKSEGAHNALKSDVLAIDQLRELVKADADNARLSFRAIDNQKLPMQYHQAGLWAAASTSSSSSTVRAGASNAAGAGTGAGGGSNPANLTGPCTCFTACLQSLRAQFDVSTPQSPPALETVVSVNRKAVDGCASMLGCWRCINRMGRHATAMLVGTVLGKVTSSYHAVARNHFGHGLGTVNAQDAAFAAAAAAPAAPTGLMPNGLAPPAGPGFVGAAAQQGGDGGIRSLELDILARDLDRLRNVYTYYCELCRHLSEDPEVTRAVIGHLGSSLSATLEMVRQFRQIIPRA